MKSNQSAICLERKERGEDRQQERTRRTHQARRKTQKAREQNKIPPPPVAASPAAPAPPAPLGTTTSIPGYHCQHPWVPPPASSATPTSIPRYRRQHPWVPPPPRHPRGRILLGMLGTGSLTEPRQGRMRPPPEPAAHTGLIRRGGLRQPVLSCSNDGGSWGVTCCPAPAGEPYVTGPGKKSVLN